MIRWLGHSQQSLRTPPPLKALTDRGTLPYAMSSNPYAPPGESPSDLWLERSNFVGAALGNIAYGVHVAVFAECAYRIYPWSGSASRQRGVLRSWFLLAYIFVLFLMNTIDVACNTRVYEQMFIDDRAFPGGPNAWYFANFSSPVNTAGNASYIIANFLADGLLLWRTYVVWDSVWVIVFPSLVFLASTAMSIMSIFQSSRPNASMWTKVAVQFSLPYFSISIALNVMLTLLLVVRLLYMSYKAKHSIGEEHGKTYISIAAMLLESGMPYAAVGLLFIITYARNSNVQNLVLPVLSQIMCISPEVIILRVAMGRAIDSRPHAPDSTLRFDHHDPDLVSSFSNDAGTKGSGSGSTTRLGSRPDLLKGDV